MPTAPRRLPLVLPQMELSGRFPRGFERAARTCRAGDAVHRALIYATATIAERGINECVSPKERPAYVEALRTAWSWGRGLTSFRQLRDARAHCFEQAPTSEKRTLNSVESALEQLSQQQPNLKPQSALSLHAREVLNRYIGLSVHHSIGGLLLTLDATKNAPDVLSVAAEVAGAIAYKKVALGACRDARLQQAALDQARWEAQRVQGSSAHDAAAIAVQRLHEYLGVHWKNHADAQRLYFEEFLAWAFNADVQDFPPSSEAPPSLETKSGGNSEPSP